MSPQPRGVIPPANQKRLLAAKVAAEQAHADAEAAQEALRTEVANALKAGGSVREVAAFTGIGTRAVREWGAARGWPTQAQIDARAEAKAWRDEFRPLGPQDSPQERHIDDESGDE